MNEIILPRIQIFARNILQATIACLTMMVQGRMLDLTIGHWQIALTTGFGAGVLAVLFSFKPLDKYLGNKWYLAASAFVATFCADIWVHPTHFGHPLQEALSTALGAAVISILMSYAGLKKGKK